MSHAYVSVNWNRRKRIYDACLWLGIGIYLATYLVISNATHSGGAALSGPIVLMRALSTCGFWMLTLILSIGPLARIDRRFLPLLYNRRHFGVSFCVIALGHAAVAIYWYHAFGDLNPVISVFTSGGDYQSVDGIPFQAFGAVALVIILIMAATSHDYWNANLGGAVWKALHMLIYPAYALIIAHITFGALREGGTGLSLVAVMASVFVVGALHLIAALGKSAAGATVSAPARSWVEVGEWRAIPNNRAVTVSINAGERIAIFRYDQTKLAAVSNVCQHQNGPLGEGRVVDGLITCPWHGYQYKPADGCSPPPFTEKVPTYRLKVEGRQVLVDPTPLPPGTPREVVEVAEVVE